MASSRPVVTYSGVPGLPRFLVTSLTNSTAETNATAPVIHERRGIVFDKWPFRLDITTEFQDWILVVTCLLVTAICCLPCICGRLRNQCSRSFTTYVYMRLHCFFCVVSYINLTILMFVIGVLPDWTVNEFVLHSVLFLSWMLVHLRKLITSICILFAFFMLVRFRNKLAFAAGMEHITVLKFNWRDMFGLGASKMRPMEIFIWKIEDLKSSPGKILKANDVFVECYMGYNEAMRTRVHNNAGHTVMVRESFQMNIDENSPATLMTLFVKDQALIGSSELARISLSTREICGIEDQTGKRREVLDYNKECFVPLSLLPHGTIWLAIAPVMDGDEERAPLMSEDSLINC